MIRSIIEFVNHPLLVLAAASLNATVATNEKSRTRRLTMAVGGPVAPTRTLDDQTAARLRGILVSVLDRDQRRALKLTRWRTLPRFRLVQALAKGNQKVKVAPPCGALSARIDPCCNVMMRLTTARPSPTCRARRPSLVQWVTSAPFRTRRHNRYTPSVIRHTAMAGRTVPPMNITGMEMAKANSGK